MGEDQTAGVKGCAARDRPAGARGASPANMESKSGQGYQQTGGQDGRLSKGRVAPCCAPKIEFKKESFDKVGLGLLTR